MTTCPIIAVDARPLGDVAPLAPVGRPGGVQGRNTWYLARDPQRPSLPVPRTASTSEVYGDPLVHPQPESYWGNVNPIGPRGVYDEAKRYAEAMTTAHHRQQGVDTCVARIFNTYGPRARPYDGRAAPTFVRQALAGKPLTVFGDGRQTRSFCYVDDVIDGLIRLAESGENDPVNLGNPDELTLLELAEEIIRQAASSSEIVFEALPIDDPKVRCPDITRARGLLGWQPTTTLQEGLARLLEYKRPRPRHIV